MLIVSHETQRKAPPKLLFNVKGARGCSESLIRLHILQELFFVLKLENVLRRTRSSRSGFIISSTVNNMNKISAYGNMAQAVHYARVVF